MVSYNVNDMGILKIYYNDKIVCEIWGCNDKSESELKEMTYEILEEMGYGL